MLALVRVREFVSPDGAYRLEHAETILGYDDLPPDVPPFGFQ